MGEPNTSLYAEQENVRLYLICTRRQLVARRDRAWTAHLDPCITEHGSTTNYSAELYRLAT